METRTFNSLMHFNNERWVAKVLGMQINPDNGVDLIDENKIVEVKFKLVYPKGYNYLSWRILGYQKDYGRNREAYWALGTYSLSKEVCDIDNSKSLAPLEKLVKKREIYLVRWNWMNQFPEYFESGKTEKSKWAHDLIFAKGKSLPKVIESIKVRGGEVLFTEGVNPKKFRIPYIK